jgi:hypothetical protein
MRKPFDALVTSINRYVAVLSIILLGFAVLLSQPVPASAGSRSTPAARSLVRPACNAIFRDCHQVSTRKSITFLRNVIAQALPITFSSCRYWRCPRVVVRLLSHIKLLAIVQA